MVVVVVVVRVRVRRKEDTHRVRGPGADEEERAIAMPSVPPRFLAVRFDFDDWPGR